MSALTYLDSSALAKLVSSEPETVALATALQTRLAWVTSALAGVELRRAARVAGLDATGRERVEEVLDCCALLAADDRTLARAASLEPSGLRTLNAVHLASAIELGDDLGALVTYDARLARAARAAGVEVLSPS